MNPRACLDSDDQTGVFHWVNCLETFPTLWSEQVAVVLQTVNLERERGGDTWYYGQTNLVLLVHRVLTVGQRLLAELTFETVGVVVASHRLAQLSHHQGTQTQVGRALTGIRKGVRL